MSQAATIDMPLTDDDAIDIPPVLERASVLTRAARTMASGLDWGFGLLSLIIGLAVFSIIPVLNFLSLGYLIHVSGRVAETGKIRAGFVGIRKASILGSFIVGTWLIALPVRFVSGMWKDAELIAPGSPTSKAWYLGLLIFTVIAILHVAWACLRGGRLRHFLWPAPVKFFKWFKTPGKFETVRNAVVDYVISLRLPYYFWLGARGFFGAFIWLFLPVSTLILAAQLPPEKGGILLSLIGGLLLMFAVLYLPFLQTHFAVTLRFKDLFAVRQVRQMFKGAPIAFWIALLITLLFALPLYLLKIELPPREIAWLPSLLFVVFIFPARMLTGWAVSRAMRHEQPRHWFFRWTSRFALVPVVIFYVFFVYITQYLSWNGSLSLLEQHAFMVPAPLMGL